MVNAHALQASIFRIAWVKIVNTNMVIAVLLTNWGSRYGEPLGCLYADKLKGLR